MSKALDHRISKTYDIKPVDKRGDLDIERISKREVLIQLKNSKREERAALMLKRFEEERKKTLQERLVFDIGNKETVDLKGQKFFKPAQESRETEEQVRRELSESEILSEEVRATEKLNLNLDVDNVEEKKEEFSSDEVKKTDNCDNAVEVEKNESEAEEKEETPEEVLENFRKNFQENQNSTMADTVEKMEKHREPQRNKQEDWQGEYRIIQGNKIFSPDEKFELQSVKIEKPKQKESQIKNFAKESDSESGIEKGRILTTEFISKERESVRDEKAATERTAIDLLAEDISAEKKAQDVKTQKELKDRWERKLTIARDEMRLRSNPSLNNNAEKEEIEFQRALQKKSNFNEGAIDSKLNAWFDYGIVEPTPKVKKLTKADSGEGTQKTKKIETPKEQSPKKKAIKFTGKIATPKITKQKTKEKRFFSRNYRKKGEDFHWRKLVAKPMLSFVTISLVTFLAIGSIVFVSYGFQIEENVKVKGEQALGYLDDAKGQLEGQDFLSAKSSFANAVEEFEGAQKELDLIGGDILNIFSTFPILSKISSGKNVVDAGNELTKAAKELSGVIEVLAEIESPFANKEGDGDKSQESMLDALLVMQEKLKVADESLVEAEKSLDLVRISDLPEEYQAKFEKIKKTLPVILSMIDVFEQNSEIFLELLGHNGPRKYLLLFQNNQEMRATGGFIGSYGVLHISNGKINKLLIEGIYNPDGQLKYNVVPPLPIQKISASWSTHDANWFPNFPTTAQKVSTFYEYTGGPTVDGIITMTPMVLQRMLDVTGPIEMSEYDATVNAENFVETTQYEVEVDYDKTENKPKQFLADLAPKIITELFDAKDPGDASEILEIFSDMLKERNIMLYSTNKDVQAVISKRGWSGEILPTEKDYLMVINSNINGFKTDGVVDEIITHNAKIADDGTIINTVKIKRTHNGGDTEYEWWNKVNCDYMRVYVPGGSKLLSVTGQTREINEPLLDYDKLGFKRDEDVVREEESISVDEETGTRIYEEEGKTVFANWVYVSPKETVEIEYTYELPFKLDTAKNQEAADTYSLLVQKQAGSFGSEFSSNVEYASEINPIWIYPQGVESKEDVLEAKTKLTTDLFFGAVFQREGAQAEAKR